MDYIRNDQIETGRAVTRKRGEKGFSLVLLALGLTVWLGMLGLAIDVGRMFLYKNELQTLTDAPALAAISKLDGTLSGVLAANTIATAGPLGTTTRATWASPPQAIRLPNMTS